MRKKFFTFCLALIVAVMCMPLTGVVAQNDEYKDLVYDYIVDDYLLITDLDKAEADRIYSEVKDNGFEATVEAEMIIYGEAINASYEDNVLYIQDNYDEIIARISEEEKVIIDKYFLAYALQYYINNGSSNDFNEVPATASVFEYEEPIFIDNEDFEAMLADEDEVILEEEATTSSESSGRKAAAVRIFADPSKSTIGSSGLEIDLGTHAWITVSNVFFTDIIVGKFIVPKGQTMALGTWGNKSEHTGLWYNLESYMIRQNDAYNDRVSLRVDITEDTLSSLNTTIIGYDKWSLTNNCSSFAVTCWNQVCTEKLSAGVINTPKNLANSIKEVSGYSTGYSVSNRYRVYYADGSNSPKISTVYVD